MKKTERQQKLEALYGEPIDELLDRKYTQGGLSQPELAAELSAKLPPDEAVPRTTLAYWLREAGVEMRARTLSDVQRIALVVLLPHLPNHTIADRVGCSTVTVKRYRRRVRSFAAAEGDEFPIDVDVSLTERDRDLLDASTASQWVTAGEDDGMGYDFAPSPVNPDPAGAGDS